MRVDDRRIRVMGGEGHVVIVGGSAALATAAVKRLDDLEARWSRFRPNSEISLLNGLPGVPFIVSPETYELVEKAVFGWHMTEGRFDPTVLDAMVANGYDRSFEELEDDGRQRDPSRRASGCGSIDLDQARLAITVPHGAELDPGGIGKGLAADVVVRELLESGAAGAMVNLGGDIRVSGRSPVGEGWVILVEDPFDVTTELCRVHLHDGAVATSSTLRRRWRRGGVDYHHLVDPFSGSPLAGDIAAVTVIAGEAWWAEVMAKSVFAAGADHASEVLTDAKALVVHIDGHQRTFHGFAEATV